jgi:NTP pyrophosphatase (non-canonical NTP hydrolase)
VDFDYYQDVAGCTDQFKTTQRESDLMVPLLGLAGETGTLLAEFKKKIRDKESYDGFKGRAEEELGDVLWYLANIASRLGLSLSTIASKNLHKTQDRWPIGGESSELFHFYDGDFPQSQQFPRVLEVKFFQDSKGKSQMQVLPDGKPLGDPLTDNAYDEDGYRFHDVFHLANMAVLAWSPVIRSLLKLKRKSRAEVDEVEDGARAIILEELIVAYVYSNARERRYYKDIKNVETEMLGTIKRLVGHLEVRDRATREWERAILKGYAAFRHLQENGEGVLRVDLKKRELLIVK